MESINNLEILNFRLESVRKMPMTSDFRIQSIALGQEKLNFIFKYDQFISKPESYSLILPAYNEERRIRPFLEDLVDKLPFNWEIIIVCDGDDDTASIARSVSDRFIVLEFKRRLGKGGAILEGFRIATGNVVGFVDADGAIGPADILSVGKTVSKESPCVVGSRWVKSSKVMRGEPRFNVLAGRVFHYLVFLLLRIPTKDTQCGIKFFTRELILDILPKITIKSRMIDVAILYHLRLLNKKVIEMGVTWEHKDETRLPIFKAIPIMFATIVALRVSHHRKLRPISHSIREFAETISHN